MKLGVLVSGSGTNLQAILEAERKGALGAEVAIVVSNRPSVGALDRAASFGVRAEVVPHTAHLGREAHEAAREATREAYDETLVKVLQDAGVELVALAGFMRLLTRRFLDAFPGRVINIHPSLLPAFPGLHAQRQALEYGVRISGCTVHFVDEGCDTGAIIAQAAVPVHDDDDEAKLSARILAAEHRLYPRAIQAICEGRVSRVGRRVILSHGSLLASD